MLLLQTRIPRIPALKSERQYTDVRPGVWYERYIVLGDRLGILKPDPVTHSIRPDAAVSRADFLVMAARTFGVNTEGYAGRYADVAQEAWYAQSASMAKDLRLFPKDSDQKSLHPDQSMTHVEMAYAVQILANLTSKDTESKSALPGGNIISTETKRFITAKPPHAAEHLASDTPIKLYTTGIRAGDDPVQLPLLRTALLKLVNEARESQKLTPLRTNILLEQSAQEYARAMAAGNFFGHLAPSGQTLRERIENSGYYKPVFSMDCLCVKQYLVGENLAQGQRTATEVTTQWLQSPIHREAMLNPVFTDAGIGISSGYWVMHFGGEQK
jgi:uncharacterized protein YkwD